MRHHHVVVGAHGVAINIGARSRSFSPAATFRRGFGCVLGATVSYVLERFLRLA